MVSGHVDGTAIITSKTADGSSIRFVLEAPKNLAGFIAPKGSVTLDGVSLTVNEVDGVAFGVNIIPHTAQVTTWDNRAPGDHMNLEIDLMARYAARLAQWNKQE
jgi:riboflavin synthase